MGPAAWFCYQLVAAYRVSLAWLVGGRCRFEPSCSIYAQQALRRHPCPTALRLIGLRLLRCHPWHRGGHDPVPGP